MVKHTQTIRRQQPTNCLGIFDHFVGLALKGIILQQATDLTLPCMLGVSVKICKIGHHRVMAGYE